MAKYNKSEIMKNAWSIRKSFNVSMSEALKKAWAKAKSSDVVSNLLASGGRRWTKNGNDRIYLSKAIGTGLDMTTEDAPCGFGFTAMSRSVHSILANAVDSTYYDVISGKLVYKKTSYSWANNHIENRFKAISA